MLTPCYPAEIQSRSEDVDKFVFWPRGLRDHPGGGDAGFPLRR